MEKLTIRSMNKGHNTTVLLHTEAYKLLFNVWTHSMWEQMYIIKF